MGSGGALVLHRRYAAVLVMLLFFIPAIPLTAPEPAQKATDLKLYQRTEWTGRSNFSSDFLFCDTDGDKWNEMIFWGDDGNRSDIRTFVQVYDLPKYRLLWSTNFSGIAEVEVVDVRMDGSLELLIYRRAPNEVYMNLTIISGKDFSTIWTSPDFGGGMDSRVVDLNRDGKNELVVHNVTGPPSWPAPAYDSRIRVYETSGFKQLWMSQNLNDNWGYDLVDLDSDAALEMVVHSWRQDHCQESSNNTILVFDGASFELEWKTPENDSVSGMYLVGFMDVDYDGQSEVVTGQYEGFGWPRPSRLVIYDGATGALEWASSFPGYLDDFQFADINGDGVQELLVTIETSTSKGDSVYNISHYIYEMKNHEMLWKFEAGLYNENHNERSSISAKEINGDGFLELMIHTVRYDNFNHSYYSSMIIFDGKTFQVLWDPAVFQGRMYFELATELDSDSYWEMLIDYHSEKNGSCSSSYSIYSTDTFTEEWATEAFAGSVQMDCRNVLGDSSPELLVDIYWEDALNHDHHDELKVLDGQTREQVWNRSFDHNYYDYDNEYESEIYFEDIAGSPWNEILIKSVIREYRDTYQEYITVYNDTTFMEEWKSETYNGTLYILQSGDIDDDGKRELIVEYNPVEQHTGEQIHNDPIYFIWEFEYSPVRLPDPAIAEQDITFSNGTPVSGVQITVTATIRNLGNVDAIDVRVEFIVSHDVVDKRRFDIAMGESISWGVNVTLDEGWHLIAFRLHLEWHVEEIDEHNNCAELLLQVRPRPPPSPVISSPAEGTTYGEGQPISLDGSASSAFLYQGLNYSWSDGEDVLGNSSTLDVTLPIGTHHLTLTVDDGFGAAETGVNLTVVPSIMTAAVISAPLDGSVFGSGELILFDGGNTTPDRVDYGLMFLWSSNISGPISVEQMSRLRLPSGTHAISLAVYDRYGGFSTASVNITVLGPGEQRPSITILIPANGAIVKGSVKIRGTAHSLSGEQAVYVRIDDGGWSEAAGTDNWSFAWDTSNAEDGIHRITAKAADDAASSAEIAIIINVKNIPAQAPAKRSSNNNGLIQIAFAACGLLAFCLSAAALFALRLRMKQRMRP